VSALPGGGGVVVELRADPSAPTRERLLRAAREVVEAEGYAGASVAAIAARAGVANGPRYRHIGSQAELFVEVFRDVCGREVGAMRAAVQAIEGEDPVGRVLAPLDAFARRALRNRTLAWALLAEPVDALVDEVRLEYRRTYRDLLVGLLADAIDVGALPPQDPELTAAALLGAVGEALVAPVSAARPSSPGGRVDAVHAGTSAGRDADDALLSGLRDVCRRATGAASRVRADATGQPR
jgi:AcrR family transcriptional regulator